MSFLLLSTTIATLKISHMRYTIIRKPKCTSTTNMSVISQVLNNRLIGRDFSSVLTKTKREDYKQTGHDNVFSEWRVLIGPNDWENFKNRKECVGRYRRAYLPPKHCTGLYELGVALISQDIDQKVDPDDVLIAYLGQSTVDVRKRLQDHGRLGSHLPQSLLEDILSKQGSVLYRYAPMGPEWYVVAVETMILKYFDYAWNKRDNGVRRQFQLFEKLFDLEFVKKRKQQVLVPLIQDQIDTIIKEEKKNNNYLTSILKLMRLFC